MVEYGYLVSNTKIGTVKLINYTIILSLCTLGLEEIVQARGVTRGQGAQFPGRRIAMGAPKSPNNFTSIFFNTVHLLPEDFKSKMGAPNLLLDPGAI